MNIKEVGKGIAFAMFSNIFVTQKYALRNEQGEALADQQQRQILPLMLGIAAFIYGVRNGNDAAIGYGIGMGAITAFRFATQCYDSQDPSCRAFTIASLGR